MTEFALFTTKRHFVVAVDDFWVVIIIAAAGKCLGVGVLHGDFTWREHTVDNGDVRDNGVVNFRPTHKAAATVGVRSKQLAIEDATYDSVINGSVIKSIGFFVDSNKATVGAVAIDVADKGEADAAVFNGVVFGRHGRIRSVGVGYEACCELVRGGDAAFNNKVLDGGTVNATERSTIVFVEITSRECPLEIQCEAITVEGSFEFSDGRHVGMCRWLIIVAHHTRGSNDTVQLDILALIAFS